MAPKNQGISGLNIGDTDTLLSQMKKQIGDAPLSYEQLLDLYSKGIMGEGKLKDRFIPKTGKFQFAPGQTRTDKILKQIGNFGLEGVDILNSGINQLDAFTNPTGNIIGDYLSSEDPKSYKDRESNISGPEMFLPNEDSSFRVGKNVTGAQTMSDVPGMDIFTEAGQEALTKKINAADGTSGVNDFDADLADSTGTTDGSETTDGSGENLTAAQTATKTALSEYLAQARPGVEPQTYDEYIKEFGDATGLDMSGEPDTKQALMSFGLALMQNRAGKGFDVSKILSSVGEAGETAMPDFRKAVAESKAVRAKAGEYALGRTKEDKNAAMNRKSYMIVPKGKKGGLEGLISGIGKGEYTQLNSYELNNLALDKKFNEEYEIVPSSTYADLAGKAITASTKTKKLYQKGSTFKPLFTGAPKGLGFNVQLPDANEAPIGTMPAFIDNPDIVVNQLVSMTKSLNEQEKTFKTLSTLLNQSDIGIPSQIASSVVQGFRNLGLDVGGTTTPLAQMQTLLTRLKAENAAEILGEAGKTLSDNDRKMVSKIVGEISFTDGDEEELARKLANLYGKIVTFGRRNIAEGYDNLAKAGVNINRKSVVSSSGKFTLGKDNIYDYTQTGE